MRLTQAASLAHARMVSGMDCEPASMLTDVSAYSGSLCALRYANQVRGDVIEPDASSVPPPEVVVVVGNRPDSTVAS